MIDSRIFVTTLALALMLAIPGCGKKGDQQKKSGDEPMATTADMASAPPERRRPAPKAKSALEVANTAPLERVNGPKMGYSVLVPKGAKTLRKTEDAHTYSFVLPGGMHELSVDLTTQTFAKPADMERMAKMGVGKIAEQKKLPDGAFYLTQRSGLLQKVWVYRKGKKVSILARCSGPHKAEKRTAELCLSLKVTR